MTTTDENTPGPHAERLDRITEALGALATRVAAVTTQLRAIQP